MPECNWGGGYPKFLIGFAHIPRVTLEANGGITSPNSFVASPLNVLISRASPGPLLLLQSELNRLFCYFASFLLSLFCFWLSAVD